MYSFIFDNIRSIFLCVTSVVPLLHFGNSKNVFAMCAECIITRCVCMSFLIVCARLCCVERDSVREWIAMIARTRMKNDKFTINRWTQSWCWFCLTRVCCNHFIFISPAKCIHTIFHSFFQCVVVLIYCCFHSLAFLRTFALFPILSHHVRFAFTATC